MGHGVNFFGGGGASLSSIKAPSVPTKQTNGLTALAATPTTIQTGGSLLGGGSDLPGFGAQKGTLSPLVEASRVGSQAPGIDDQPTLGTTGRVGKEVITPTPTPVDPPTLGSNILDNINSDFTKSLAEFQGDVRENFQGFGSVPTNLAEAALTIDFGRSYYPTVQYNEQKEFYSIDGFSPVSAEQAAALNPPLPLDSLLAGVRLRDENVNIAWELRTTKAELTSRFIEGQGKAVLEAAQFQLGRALDLELNNLREGQALKIQELENQGRLELAKVTGTEARKTLSNEYGFRKTELEKQYQLREEEFKNENNRQIQRIVEQANQERASLVLKQDLDINIMERQAQIADDMQAATFEFQSNQAALNRALQAGELAEVNRASEANEAIRDRQLQLESSGLKISIMGMIAQSPELLFFGQKNGLLTALGDILGDDGASLSAMLADINSKGRVNIQQFSTFSAEQQSQEAFRIRAQTGTSLPGEVLRGEAPRAAITRSQLSAPIRIGRTT